jgi:hypothetical protein
MLKIATTAFLAIFLNYRRLTGSIWLSRESNYKYMNRLLASNEIESFGRLRVEFICYIKVCVFLVDALTCNITTKAIWLRENADLMQRITIEIY